MTNIPDSTSTPRLHFLLALDPARMRRARDRIRDYLQAQCCIPAAVDDIVLAVEEAMTNAVRHSGASDDLEVSMRFEGSDLIAEVKDRGCGFDTTDLDPDRRPDPTLPGGRGLFLMSKLMDEFTLSCDGGIEIRAVKRSALDEHPAEGSRGQWSVSSDVVHGEGRQTAILEEIDEAFAALDWEYRFRHVNAACERQLGRARHELLGHSLWDLFPDAAGHQAARSYRDAMELGRASIVEYESPVVGGWVEARIYPASSGISVYLRDIGERKRKELEREELLAALRDSEERYRGLFQSESDALLLIDHESGRVLEANPAAEAMYGYAAEELLGLTDLDLSAEPELTRASTRAAAAGEDVTVPSRLHRRKDGTSFAVEMTGRVCTLQGRLVRVVAVRDITARKRAEEALGRFELLAADSRDIILFMDRDGRIIEANEAAERAYGYTRDELLGLTIADLRAAQTQAAIAPQMTEADERGILFESLHRRRDGSVFPVEVSSRGATVGGRRTLVSIIRDIAERKGVEDALRASEERYRSIVELATERLAVEPDGILSLDSKAPRGAALRAASGGTHQRMQRLLETVSAQRLHRVRTTLIALVVELAYLLPLGLGPTRNVLGMPGSLLALTVIVVGVVAGTWPAVASALGGAAIFYFTVARHGQHASPLAVAISAGIWVAAAVLSSLLADTLLEQSTRRREAAVAFVQAETARREQSAELRSAQRIASALQENLIHALPVVPGLDLGRVARAAIAPELVGGDFSDVVLLDDGHVAILIGDVAGKGVEAAGLTETVHSMVRAFATVDASPAFVLRKTNELLLRHEPDPHHVTAFYCLLDPCTGHLAYASAGHPAPIHVGPDLCRPLTVRFGTPLGAFKGDYDSAHATITLDDYLVLYTDGVTEARRAGEMFGEERLLKVLARLRGRSAQELAEGLVAAVTAYADRLADDVEVVVLRLA